jgi:hypothetical protein
VSIICEVTVQWSATPEQLSALGGALWRWCVRGAGGAGIYGCLDSQPLADLIAGTLPRSGRVGPRGMQFRLQDEASRSRQATIDSLRGAIPVKGVEDIVVDGVSWKWAGSEKPEGSESDNDREEGGK